MAASPHPTYANGEPVLLGDWVRSNPYGEGEKDGQVRELIWYADVPAHLRKHEALISLVGRPNLFFEPSELTFLRRADSEEGA